MRFGRLQLGEFGRAVAVLSAGTAVGHLITAVATPFLTRIYSPSEYGVLAAFVGISATLASVACLRWDIAIAVPADDREASRLFALATVSAAAFALLLFGAVTLFGDSLQGITTGIATTKWLYWIPVSVFVAAVLSAAQNFAIRHKSFGAITRSKVVQSSVTVGVQAAAGTIKFGHLGLVVGYICGFIAAAFVFLRLPRPLVEWGKLAATARDFRRYPLFSTWEAFANNASLHLPMFWIASFADPKQAGLLSLAIMVAQVPMALIGTSIGQVYLAQASGVNARELAEVTAQTLRKLLRLGVLPIALIGLLAPYFFAVIFGVPWRGAGELVTWMAPWFILQFLAAPISMGLHVAGRQGVAMVLQFTVLFARFGAVLVATRFDLPHVAEWFAVSSAVAYGAYLAAILRVTGVWRAGVRRGSGHS